MANTKTLTGIDITAGEIRLVQLTAGGGSARALRTHSARIPDGSEPHAKRAAAALRSLIGNNGLKVRKASAVLSGDAAMFRCSLLPAGTPAEIDGMARLEMEYASMLPSSSLCVSAAPLGARHPGGWRTAITAAAKRDAAALAAILKTAGVVPAAITHGATAAARYFAPILDGDESILLLHGDLSGTDAYIVTGHGPVMAMHVPGPPGGGKTCIDAVTAAARLCVANAPFATPSRILLIGDTSALPSPEGIAKSLGLHVDVSLGRELEPDGSLEGFQRAAGAALELETGGAGLLTFGVDASAAAARNKLAFRAAASAAIVLAAAAISSSASALREQSRQLADADAKIASLKPRVAKIEKMRTELRMLEPGAGSAPGCLDAMLELSGILPAGVYVTGLTYDRGGDASVSGETSTQLRVANTIRALEQSRMFGDVQLAYSRQAETPGGPIVTFEIKATAERGGDE